jgi:hypothetical protein
MVIECTHVTVFHWNDGEMANDILQYDVERDTFSPPANDNNDTVKFGVGCRK